MSEKVKVKTGLSFVNTDYQSFDPALSAEDWRGSNYVRWGSGNAFPKYLLDSYNNCVTLQSIINGSIDYTMGNGVEVNIAAPYFEHVNEYGETVQDVIERCATDRWIFGGFAIQVKYNTFGYIISISYIDFCKLRTDRAGEFIYVMDSKNMTYATGDCRKIRAFNPETGAADGVQIYYFKGLRTRDTYPKPDYYAALPAVQNYIQIQKFHLAEINNNFMPSAFVKFKGPVPDEEMQILIQKRLADQFAGEGKQGRFLVTWCENENDVVVTRIPSDDFDNRYHAAEQSIRESIFSSLSAPPTIFGVLTPTGFADQNYDDAFRLYNKTKIVPKQQEFVRIFNEIFGMQEDKGAIEFVPFNIENNKLNADTVNAVTAGLNAALSVSAISLSEYRNELSKVLDINPDIVDDGSTEDDVILASVLGVGGTQAFTALVSDPNLTDDQKKGLLSVLFNLTDEQIGRIFKNKSDTLPAPQTIKTPQNE